MTLRLMRGYPGSGKTTLALEWVAGDEEKRRRVNRDDIRSMTFGRYIDVDEMEVTRIQKAIVESHLRRRRDVVIDDTNLKLRNLKQWVQVANRHAHQVEIVDVTTSMEESMQRDLNRGAKVFGEGGRTVGEDVVESFAKRYPMPWPTVDLPAVVEPDFRKVEPVLGALPTTMIVDLDGTMAIHDGRSPYDYTKVGTDLLNDTVGMVVGELALADWPAIEEVIFLSGRPDSCRRDTEQWLAEQGWGAPPLLMRRAGDERADYVVKYEIFDREIRDKYDVRLVLDDRDQVVDMWRAIGLPCWQVNRGDF